MRRIGILTLAVGLAGCEQETQPLPFDVAEATVRAIPAAGATLSTAAGASVAFPGGSVTAGATVTLAPTAAGAAYQGSGTAASSAFRLEPAGLALARPAVMEVRLDAGADRSRLWLASLVSRTPAGTRELGGSRVDLSTGVVRSQIGELGTVAAVIPDPAAVFFLRREAARSALVGSAGVASLGAVVGTDSVSIRCGDPEARCTGITLTASQNLLDMAEDAAAVYPALDGAIRFAGGRASGRIALSTSVRVLLRSGATAETVEINAALEPTDASVVSESASQITVTQVRWTIEGASGDESRRHAEIGTLSISKADGAGTISVSRTFEMRNSSGQLEPATVTVGFPVQIHP